MTSTKRSIRRSRSLGASIAVAALAATSVLAASPAFALNRYISQTISCTGFAELHTASVAYGTVQHRAYNAGPGVGGNFTSAVDVGYSSTYTNWDSHHWLITYASGGAVWADGGDAKSGNFYCT